MQRSFPSLAHSAKCSVTEIEILHGALSQGLDVSDALFFIRDPAWINTLPAGQRRDYAAENPIAAAKLNDLKRRIRARGARVYDYADPIHFAEALRHRLWALLDERCPKTADGPFEKAHRLHEAYGRDRLGELVGVEHHIAGLDAWVKTPDPLAMLISGDGGAGKTALMANWLRARRSESPDTLIFEHYVGAAPDSADPIQLMRRLWEHLNRATGEVMTAPTARADLLEWSDAIQTRLAAASAWAASKTIDIVIAIDGLEKLDGDGSLRWLPLLPERVKVLVSSAGGEPTRLLRAGRNPEICLEPLSASGRQTCVARVLSGWGRTLVAEHVRPIVEHALGGNPLFLRTMLEELRYSATHSELSKRIAFYAQAKDLTGLFERVLARLEDEANDRSALITALGAIWAGRNGLEEADILAISGLSLIDWAKVCNGLATSLCRQDGRIACDTGFLHHAIMARHFATRESRQTIRLRVADHYLALGPTRRAAEEAPRQLRGGGDLQKLKAILTDIDWHQAILALGESELHRAWLWLEGEGSDIEAELCDAFEDWQREPSFWRPNRFGFADAFVDFLAFCGAASGRYVGLAKDVAAQFERTFGPEEPQTLRVLNRRAHRCA